MTTKQIAPPAALAVSLADAKLTLRIEADEASLDSQITMLVESATAEAEHATGRSFIARQMLVALDAFPDAIRLDGAPIASVDSVRFMDSDGAMQTLDPADYYVDSITEPGYIIPASGKAWPPTATHANAVQVQYTAGYGATSESVPRAAQAFILARVQEQFDKAEPSPHLAGILDSLRVYG